MFSKHLNDNKKEIKGKEIYVEDIRISNLDIGGESCGESFETQIDEQACNVSYTLYKPNVKKKIFLSMQKFYTIKKIPHTGDTIFLDQCG